MIWRVTAVKSVPSFFLFFCFFFFNLFLAALGLGPRCCMRAFSSCCAWASHCSGFSLQITGSRCAGFSSCGAQAQLLCSMWGLPGPGLEPVSPALAGGFLTTAPPGKSQSPHFSWQHTKYPPAKLWTFPLSPHPKVDTGIDTTFPQGLISILVSASSSTLQTLKTHWTGQFSLFSNQFSLHKSSVKLNQKFSNSILYIK